MDDINWEQQISDRARKRRLETMLVDDPLFDQSWCPLGPPSIRSADMCENCYELFFKRNYWTGNWVPDHKELLGAPEFPKNWNDFTEEEFICRCDCHIQEGYPDGLWCGPVVIA